MARVFISHAGADTAWAEQVRLWLKDDGHDAFLDRDRNDGILPGEEWENRLYAELRKADAVVCVVTDAYLKSVWCAAEIGAARALGTELLPVRFSLDGERHTLLKPIHGVDAAADPSDAQARLRDRLRVIDGGGGWGWPDEKSPYPGLRPFDLGEHRVFFGRSREITLIGERLRSPERATPAILTVVGPSGCGKSSLIRAGVLPRIGVEDYWLPVPPILPGTDPFDGLVRAIAAMIQERHIAFDVASLRANISRDGLKAIATDLLIAAGTDSRCKLLIVIDQFEELLTQTAPAERAEFVTTLGPALGGPVQALATLRPEFLDPLARDPDLSRFALRIQQIRPLDADALRSVIEEPATVAGLSFEPDLVTRLVTDTGTGDALPLLAFTLEQLAHGTKRGDLLTHQRYLDIGGVNGALQRQADAALQDAVGKTGVTDDQVIAALLSLVTIDEQGRPTKRRVALTEFSSAVAAELEPFISRRLLSTEAVGEKTYVAVAHEAFLVNWPPLTAEIDEQVTALRARRVVENAASDWVASGQDAGSLLQGRQLTKATVDIGAELEGRRVVTRVDLNDTGQAFLAASMLSERLRRRKVLASVTGAIAVLLVFALVATVGFVRASSSEKRAQASANRAIAARLVNEAADIFAQNRAGGDIQAFDRLIAADALAADTAAGGLLDAVMRRLTTAKIIDAGAGVYAVAFSPDGRRLVGGGRDAMLRIWNADTGELLRAVPTGHTDWVSAVAVSPDGRTLATAGRDGTVRLWDANTGQPAGPPLIGHTASVGSVAFSPDGRRLASGGDDNAVRLWDVETGRQLGEPMIGKLWPIASVAFAPDGRRLASGGQWGEVRLWDVETHQPIGVGFVGHTLSVNGLAFSPDGRRLATGSDDETVRLWDADTGRPLGEPLTGHTGRVESVAFSPDGTRLVSGSMDETVRIWDADTGKPVGVPLIGHTEGVNSVAFSPDGRRIVSASDDQTVRLWNADAGAPLMNRPTDDTFGHGLTADGRYLATTGPDPETLRLWDIGSRQPGVTVQTPYPKAVQQVAVSADGKLIATVGDFEDVVRLWDGGTGQPVGAPLTGHTDQVISLAVSPDGRRLAAGGSDHTVWLWDVATGDPVGAPLTAHTDLVTSVAFSPDGRRLATASYDHTARLWDAGTGQPLDAAMTHPDMVLAVVFSPDGSRLATSGRDKTVRLWNATTGQELGAPMTVPSGPADQLAFSPDGRRLVSADTQSLQLWDVDSGQPLGGPLTAEGRPIVGVAFSGDGRRLIAATDTATVWSWPAAATPQMLCDKLTTNMNREQWRDWISPDTGYRELCPGLPVAAG